MYYRLSPNGYDPGRCRIAFVGSRIFHYLWSYVLDQCLVASYIANLSAFDSCVVIDDLTRISTGIAISLPLS
jgi:hypothetical protein